MAIVHNFNLNYTNISNFDFDWICGRTHGLLWACIPDSLALLSPLIVSCEKNGFFAYLTYKCITGMYTISEKLFYFDPVQ